MYHTTTPHTTGVTLDQMHDMLAAEAEALESTYASPCGMCPTQEESYGDLPTTVDEVSDEELAADRRMAAEEQTIRDERMEYIRTWEWAVARKMTPPTMEQVRELMRAK